MSKLKIGAVGAAIAVAASLLVLAATALANGTVVYAGQGFTYDGTTYSLTDQRCGLDGQGAANDGGTGQFANWNGAGQPYQTGQPYMVWVLTANGATSATITLPDGTHNMINVGGTFKYASPYFSHDDLVGGNVSATYVGKAKGNVQLTVSHGCPGFTTQGAWCSPGFWRNAKDGAWQKAGYLSAADGLAALFNNTVVPNYYDTPSVADPTLGTVLNTPGANTFGGPSGPFGLNAFNAVGAYLTDQIDGYQFDPSLIPPEGDNDEETCPIDHFGNVIPPS
jgi:hypothetical protein